MLTDKPTWVVPTASLMGLTGVVLGALAAHALEATLSPARLAAFETAVRYQLYHALALLALAALPKLATKTRTWVARGWVLGVLLFSGSIYGLAATGWGVLGPITPIGGVFLIAGWALLFVSSLSKPATRS